MDSSLCSKSYFPITEDFISSIRVSIESSKLIEEYSIEHSLLFSLLQKSDSPKFKKVPLVLIYLNIQTHHSP